MSWSGAMAWTIGIRPHSPNSGTSWRFHASGCASSSAKRSVSSRAASMAASYATPWPERDTSNPFMGRAFGSGLFSYPASFLLISTNDQERHEKRNLGGRHDFCIVFGGGGLQVALYDGPVGAANGSGAPLGLFGRCIERLPLSRQCG